MIKFTNKKVIEVYDWDKLVQETYGRHYKFQQQDGCQGRGTVELEVSKEDYSEEDNRQNPDTVPEIVNGNEMQVNFKSWLARDPKQKLNNPEDQYDWSIDLWWERNFYPDVQMIANDLCRKGLIEEGSYTINIDW